MGKDIKQLFSDVGFIFKVVEAVLCLIGVIVSNSGVYYYHQSQDLLIVAVAGYLLITSAFIVVYICDETHKLLEMMLIFVGAILNLVAGILCLVNGSDSNHRHRNSLVLAITTTACGILCFIGVLILTNYFVWYYSNSHELVVLAVAGYLLITVAFIVVYICDETHYLLEVMLIFVGGILNLVAGILTLVDVNDYYDRHRYTLFLAITTTACGVIMIIDFVFLVQKKK